MSQRLRTFLVLVSVLRCSPDRRRPRFATRSPGRPRPSASRAAPRSTRWPTPSPTRRRNNLPVDLGLRRLHLSLQPRARGLRAQRRDARARSSSSVPRRSGRGKFNVNVSCQYVEFNQFDGDRPRATSRARPDRAAHTSTRPATSWASRPNRSQYRLGLRNNIAAFSFTYGVLDNLDVNLLLPRHRHGARGRRSTAQQVQTAGPDGIFAPDTGPLHGRLGRRATPSASATCCCALKYQLPRFDWLRSASACSSASPPATRTTSRAPATSGSRRPSTPPRSSGTGSSPS